MAVYKRTYKTYSGARTAAWSRFLVLTRYSYARVFQSKFLLLFIAACLFYPVGCLVFVYVSNNEAVRGLLSLNDAKLPTFDGKFFYVFCRVQGTFAYLLTALVSPGMVSPDLTNGALPLYFSRPFSRAEYVAGKMALLIFLLSLITWIPGLILFGAQAGMAGWDWTKANLWLGGAMMLSLLIWIIILSLVGLAMSAWVRWKIAASALVLAVFFAGAGFGGAINNVLRTHYGGLISLNEIIRTIWGSLLQYDWGAELSLTEAWFVAGLTCAVCAWMLARRIRPLEVVK